MKKLLILLLLLTSIITPISIHASDVQTEVSSESVSLIDKGFVTFSNVTFSMSNYMSTGYVTLNMGYSTTYTINLSNVLQYFDHYNHDNVANIYLQFDLGSVYTGYSNSQQQWLSSNPNWNSTTKRLSLGSTIPTSAAAEIWWNIIGQSGGAPSTAPGGLRLYSINLVVEYNEPIQLYTPIYEWSDLPIGNNLFNSYQDLYAIPASEEVVTATIEPTGTGKHNVYIELESGSYVAMNMTLPAEVRNSNPPLVTYFATKDYKFLLFYMELKTNIIEADYLLWNLTTNEYNIITSGTVYGYPYVNGNGITTYNMMYVDFSIPWKIDDIISIELSYQYRYHYITGNYGENQSGSKTLFANAYTNVAYPWWTKYMGLYTLAASALKENAEFLAYNQIVNVTNSYDLSKKAAFVSFLNANTDGVTYTVNNVFPTGSTVAKVFIGQFDRFGSNGVEPIDVVMMDIRWVTNGIEYSKPYPNQVIPNPPPVYPNDPVRTGNPLDTLLDWLWEMLSSVYVIFVAIIAYGMMRLAMFVVPKRHRFNPIIRILITGAFFLIIYFSYKP